MAKYIVAEWFESEMHNRTDACLKWIDEAKNEEIKNRAEATFSAFVEVALTFKDAPTIEIIHCCECKHASITADGYTNKWCDVHEMDFEADFFCKEGEPKEVTK